MRIFEQLQYSHWSYGADCSTAYECQMSWLAVARERAARAHISRLAGWQDAGQSGRRW